MKKYIKLEIVIVVLSLLISLLAFWVEPSISNVSKKAGTTVTTVGWPFATQKTTSGLDVSYVGPYTSNSTSGMVYDWLALLIVVLVAINAGWWILASTSKKHSPITKSEDSQ